MRAPLDSFTRLYSTLADAEADFARGKIADDTIRQVRAAAAARKQLLCTFTAPRKGECSCCRCELPWGASLCSGCAEPCDVVLGLDEDCDRWPLASVEEGVGILYERNGVGCCLHIALDDYNLEDDSLDFCIDWARKAGHPLCEGLAKEIRLMSLVERYRLCGLPDTGPVDFDGVAPGLDWNGAPSKSPSRIE